MRHGESGRRRTVVGALLAAAALVMALLGPVGATPATARPSSPTELAKPAPKLSISGITVECECGGAGYLWGWRSVAVNFTGARKGHTYRVAVKGGPTIRATAYGKNGWAYISRDEGGFVEGRTYRFTVKELKGKKVVRTSKARAYTVPTPVGAPARAHIDTITRDGEEVMVAGETYRITFADGEWDEGIRFASGVDRYFGSEDGDQRFGWYGEDGYPLPWQTKGTEPILELTPTEEFVGTTWSILVVGYRVADRTDRSAGLRKGQPEPGSEWGFWFTAKVVAS